MCSWSKANPAVTSSSSNHRTADIIAVKKISQMQTDATRDRAGVKVEMKTRWNHIKFPGPSWASISSEQPAAKRRGWSRWQAQPPSIGQHTHGQGSHTGPSRGESRNEKDITLYNIPWAPYQIFWAPYFLAGPSIICTPKRLYQCFSENIN